MTHDALSKLPCLAGGGAATTGKAVAGTPCLSLRVSTATCVIKLGSLCFVRTRSLHWGLGFRAMACNILQKFGKRAGPAAMLRDHILAEPQCLAGCGLRV